jgi:hypothetical protein
MRVDRFRMIDPADSGAGQYEGADIRMTSHLFHGFRVSVDPIYPPSDCRRDMSSLPIKLLARIAVFEPEAERTCSLGIQRCRS